MIKIGIIGSSSISHKFCEAINQQAKIHKNFALQANYSRNLEKAKSFAKELNIKQSFNSKQELLNVIDLVYIATPNKLHFADVKQALEAGVHVIVEKPMTTTSDQTRELFELAKAQDLVLVEAIKTCTMNTYQHLVKGIDRLGELQSFRLNMMREYGNFPTADNYPNIYKPEMEGGVINDLGSYAFFPLFDMIYKEEQINDLNTKLITDNYGLDVEVETIISFQSRLSKVHGIVSLSMVNSDPSKSYIYGTNGYVTIDSLSQFNQVKYYDLNDNLIETIDCTNKHLMQSELLSTIELIANNQRESDIHNCSKSIKVATLIESLHALTEL